jgi:uncharacterized membrane protein YGL010W
MLWVNLKKLVFITIFALLLDVKFGILVSTLTNLENTDFSLCNDESERFQKYSVFT